MTCLMRTDTRSVMMRAQSCAAALWPPCWINRRYGRKGILMAHNPDWAAAPAWARWWACDGDGESYWFECQPTLSGSAWCKGTGRREMAGIINLYHIDYRSTCQSMPAHLCL